MNTVIFKEIKDLESDFSSDYPLENELLGTHPYVINNFFEENNQDLDVESFKEILFFSPLYNDETLDDLTKKIIDSFKFNKDQFDHLFFSKEMDVSKLINSKKPKLIIFLGDFKPFCDDLVTWKYSPGHLTKGLEINEMSVSCACLWSSKELNDNPSLKKSAWSLIQEVCKGCF